MRFNFTDAWILHAVHFSETADGFAELADIISYADYINHAVIMYAEFEKALNKLIPIGIIKQQDQKLSTTRKYKDWWDKQFTGKKNIDVSEIIDHIQVYLNQAFGNAGYPATGLALFISEKQFSEIVAAYVNK